MTGTCHRVSFHLLSYAEESVQFLCRYGRTINVQSQLSVGVPQPQPVQGEGNFSYTMDAQVGRHGGNTILNINANHNFDGITPV